MADKRERARRIKRLLAEAQKELDEALAWSRFYARCLSMSQEVRDLNHKLQQADWETERRRQHVDKLKRLLHETENS